MAITGSMLDRAHGDHRDSRGGTRDDYFAMLYLQHVLGVSAEASLAQTSFGPEDVGAGAFHFDADRRILYLIIATASRTYTPLLPRLERLVQVGIPCLFANPQPAANASSGGLEALVSAVSGPPSTVDGPFVAAFRGALFSEAERVNRVLVRLVVNAKADLARGSAALLQLREDLEAQAYRVEEYFGRKVLLASELHSPNDGWPADIRISKRPTRFTIRVDGALGHRGPRGEAMLVGFAALGDLCQIYRDLGHMFLDKNVRAGLREDTAPNRAIAQALQEALVDESADPAAFAFNHNGVTLYAASADKTSEGVVLTEPRLLNGAQSISTLNRFLSKMETRSASFKRRLDALRVLCKIITEADKEFIGQVTINNNRQNPVYPWHLRSNDSIQMRLQDVFIEELGIYYERQENALESLDEDDRVAMGIFEDRRAIQMLNLAKTYLASDGEVDKMSTMESVFEDKSTYARVFSAGRLTVEPRYTVLCYKVHYRVRQLLGAILARGAEKYAFIYRARNLVWALLCQAILNDDRLDGMAERFGEDLVASDPYMEWLLELVSTRVRFLVSDLVAQEPYLSLVAAENHSFLRTRGAFERCFKAGQEKFGWHRKRLLGRGGS